MLVHINLLLGYTDSVIKFTTVYYCTFKRASLLVKLFLII